MIMRILHLGEKQLREISQPVEAFDEQLRSLVKDMFETMYNNNGVGLAAPQVGINKRLFVIDAGEQPMVFVNPEIVKTSGKETCEEGCLSLPGLQEVVTRAKSIKAHAFDVDGKAFEIEADGLLARAFQHELDHLDGILFVDRISKARKLQIRRELAIIEAGGTVGGDYDEEQETEELDAKSVLASK